MLDFFLAKDDGSPAFFLPVNVTVIVGGIPLVVHDLVLALRAGVSHFWACMVLWETVGCAELSTAVLTGEGENCFG